LADLKKSPETKTVSVTSINSKTDKGPSEKNTSALKDLLARVAPNQAGVSPAATGQAPHTASVPKPQPEVKKEERPQPPSPHKPKEVPEDVLRQILQ
jgi:hypothetical protein